MSFQRIRIPAALSIGATVIAACQVGPAPTVPDVGASSAPSETPSVAASLSPVSPTPSASVSAAPKFLVLSGRVFDDQGLRLERGTVIVTSLSDPSYRLDGQVAGGTYVFPEVPAGALIRVRVDSPGFTARERTLLVPSGVPAFSFDFGAEDASLRFALSEFPEIAAITPANQATGVTAQPLVLSMKLSHPLPDTERRRFERILQVKFQVSGAASILQVGTYYDNVTPSLTWNDAGDEATFRFDGPLVTRGTDAAVIVGLDDTVPLEDWPKLTNGKMLGRDRAARTFDGSGAGVVFRVAPFLRDLERVELAPSPRPSSINIWGATHSVSSVFTLAPDTVPARVVSVRGVRSVTGGDDRLEVTFSEPMRGFPAAALDAGALTNSNYRFILAETTKQADIERFQQADPKTEGGSSGLPLAFSSSDPKVVYIPLGAGALTRFTDVKLYVDPAVKDLGGNPLHTSPQDPTTKLSDNVLTGKIH
ncbi:hypothetical protein D3C72_529920 [compost metagenome]